MAHHGGVFHQGAQHHLVRSMSLTDSMDVQREALDKLSTLEAEVILLHDLLPEATRDKLIRLVLGVRDEFVAAVATIRRNSAIVPLSRKEAILTPSAAAVSSNQAGGGSFAFKQPSGAGITQQRIGRQHHNHNNSNDIVVPRLVPIAATRTSSDATEVVVRSSGSDNNKDPNAATISPNHYVSRERSLLQFEHSTAHAALQQQTPGAVLISQPPTAPTTPRPLDAHIKGTSKSGQPSSPLKQHHHQHSSHGNNKAGGGGAFTSRTSPSNQMSPLTSGNNNHHFNSSFDSFPLRPVPPPPPPSTYGHCIAAALYMSLEAILVACEAERLAVYAKSTRTSSLELAVAVGVGVPPAKKGVLASTVGLVHAVYSTQIAANLDTVTLEDVSECPGPTAARNALLFPIVDTSPNTGLRETLGVIILINKQKGLQPFNDADEHHLHMRLPVVAHILRQYPIEFAAFSFDPVPLHRLAPLPQWEAPLTSIPAELCAAPHVQKVFHRDGAEKFIRKQALTQTDDIVAAPTTAESVCSVEVYLAVLEDCWKRGIHDRIEVELTLRQKMQHLTDAREILVRKQKKYEILKETLCEQLEQTLNEATGGVKSRRR